MTSLHPQLSTDTSLSATRFVVWGLGYIGLTTAHELLKQDLWVLGVDIDPSRLEELRRDSVSLNRAVSSLCLDFRPFVSSGQLQLATSFAGPTPDTTVHFVCVPTNDEGAAADRALASVLRVVGAQSPDSTVIVESTIAPSWLDRDYFAGVRLCLAPRRDWFHGSECGVRNLARIFGATDPATHEHAERVLRLVSDQVVPSPNVRAVAFAKAFENSLWMIMAAYTNYLSDEFADIDMYEVTRLAQTNWRTPFHLYPALRVGGYCLPVSLEYISDGMPEPRRTLAAAVRRLNDAVADHLVARVVARGAQAVLVLGLCYRPDVPVHANSAGLFIAQQLLRHGVECRVHDPLYGSADIERITGAAAAVLPDDLLWADAVILCMNQAEYASIDLHRVCAERDGRELVIYDGPGLWRDSPAVAAHGHMLRYHALGTPSWHDGPVGTLGMG